jgi:hypothetical protein
LAVIHLAGDPSYLTEVFTFLVEHFDNLRMDLDSTVIAKQPQARSEPMALVASPCVVLGLILRFSDCDVTYT